MKYDNNIYFHHLDEDIVVTFNLKSKSGDVMNFEILTHYGLFETKSITEFKTADIQELQQIFWRIYYNAPKSYRYVVSSSDILTKIVITDDNYGHVIISFDIKYDFSNAVQADIKTDLASLPYLISEIHQCLNVNDRENIKNDESVEYCQKVCYLRTSVEKYFYEEDIYQQFYDLNIFFTSDFVTFSLLITLYDFEYSKLMDEVNEHDDFLFYIRPLDNGGVDLSFHSHNHLITFQGNICDNEKGYSFIFCSNMSNHLYNEFVRSLKTLTNRCRKSNIT